MAEHKTDYYRKFADVPIERNSQVCTALLLKATECKPQSGKIAIEFFSSDTQKKLDKESVTIDLWIPEQKENMGIGRVVQLPDSYEGKIKQNDIVIYQLQTSVTYKKVDYVAAAFIIAVVGYCSDFKDEYTTPSGIQSSGGIIL